MIQRDLTLVSALFNFNFIPLTALTDTYMDANPQPAAHADAHNPQMQQLMHRFRSKNDLFRYLNEAVQGKHPSPYRFLHFAFELMQQPSIRH